MRTPPWFILLLPLTLGAEPSARWAFTELRRVPAAEARQGVAVDATHFYAINNFAIGKYRRDTGERVAGWSGEEGRPFTHFNAGLLVDGRLYCSHSNYPGVPHRSSVVVFDPAAVRPERTIDLGETDGSLCWVDRRGDAWLACMTHYGKKGGMPGRRPEDTWLAEYDSDWKLRGRWEFPPDLLARLAVHGYSVSGGAVGPRGFLYVTGHDEPQLFVLRFPAEGRRLEWIATVPIPAEGQAFSWDPADPGVVHLILKRTREIISGRVHVPPAPPPPVTVGCLKLIPRPGDKAGNYARFEAAARQAAAGGARLLVTSECYLDGYLGHQRMHPETTPESLAAIAEPVDGPYVRRAAALAAELGVHIVFGFSERRGDKTYNTAALLGPGGRVLGTYSKSHTGGELYEPGNAFPVFATPLGRIGLLICFDRQVPETSRLLALRGAELIVIPAHSPVVDRINEDDMMRIRAYENNVFVVLANPFNTLVANPDGDLVVHNSDREAEGVVYARIDLSRRDLDRGALANRRPELYGELAGAAPLTP